jgi:DNA-binding NtrC family response regulator
MPPIRGCALSERLKQLYPEMKVVYISVYTENTIVPLGMVDFDVNFLSNPFRVPALVQKVREVLDTNSPL